MPSFPIFKPPSGIYPMKLFAILPILAIVLVSGCTGSGKPPAPAPITEPQFPASADISITSSGFSPRTLTIQSGQPVNFLNKDSAAHWPASAAHPTHEVYPGSSITKCGSAEQTEIFDACHDLAPGESWTFTFSEKGTWNYHDHLNPSLIGTIIVQ